MERNVTSLDTVPGGLSKQSQAVAFSLSGLPPPCVWLYLEAGTTAVPHPCHPSRPPPAPGETSSPPCQPVQGCCLICALPENLASSGTFYMEPFCSEEKIEEH